MSALNPRRYLRQSDSVLCDVLESEDRSNLWMKPSMVKNEELWTSQQSNLDTLHMLQMNCNELAPNKKDFFHYPSIEETFNILPPDLSVTKIFEEAERTQQRRRGVQICRNEASRSPPLFLSLDEYESSSSSRSFQSPEDSFDEHYHSSSCHENRVCGPQSIYSLHDEIAGRIETAGQDRNQDIYSTERKGGRRSHFTREGDAYYNNSVVGYESYQSNLPDLDQTSCHSTNHHDNSEREFWNRSEPGLHCEKKSYQGEHSHFSQSTFPSGRNRHDEPYEDSYGYQQQSPRPSFHSQSCGSSVTTIEIAPGHFLTLRGAEETLRAIEQGMWVTVPCLVCNARLQCIADCEMVLCPDCRVVSPNADDEGFDRKMSSFPKPNHGVGLGVKI